MTTKDKHYVVLKARYGGKCRDQDCQEPFQPGDAIVWDVREGVAYCLQCGAQREESETP